MCGVDQGYFRSSEREWTVYSLHVPPCLYEHYTGTLEEEGEGEAELPLLYAAHSALITKPSNEEEKLQKSHYNIAHYYLK